jgi:hypothetical protein
MKILLLDTAFAAAPIYSSLIACGHDVWVAGNRSGDLLARKAGANWIEQDYGQTVAIQHHVARLGIDRVVPGCTDVSIETCLRLNAGPHLGDSPEVNTTLSNKQLFRKLCAQLDLPAPRVLEAAAFPLPGQFICKPVDAFSGRGMTVFDGSDLPALHQALSTARAASPTSSAIIETFVAGDLHSCTAFVENHKLTDAFFVKEGASVNPFAVDTSYVVHDMPLECIRLLCESLEKLCASLKLRDGLLHTQFILSGTKPMIIEIMRRCPGDLYSLLIEYSTGFRYAAKYASYFLGEKLDARPKARRHILRHTVTADEDVPFGGLTFGDSPRVCGFFPITAMGGQLRARQGNRAGILFCEHSSYADLLNAHQLFLERRAYRVDGFTPA